MEQWQLDTAERLARIEESVKHIVVKVDNKDIEMRVKTLESFRDEILKRIAWVSGAFAVLSSGLVYGFDYIKNHLSFN